MIRHSYISSTLIAALVFSTATAWSQQPAKPPKPPAPGQAAPATPPPNLDLEKNPAVRAALELPRTQPKHYVSAILALVDLGRPELAAPILKELQGLNLTDEQRAQLVTDFGSHRFLQLSRNTDLAPASQQFAEACMTAAATVNRDPQRIAGLVADLTNPSAEIRHAAAVDLGAAGQDGVNAALIALAKEPDAQNRGLISVAVAQMSPEAVKPLLAMLVQFRDDKGRGQDVIRIVQALQVSQAAPLIAAYNHSPDAEQLLVAALDRYQRGAPAFITDDNDQVKEWKWCKGDLDACQFSAKGAQADWMARLALALAELRPDVREYQRQALMLGLDAGLWHKWDPERPVGICDLAYGDTQRIVDTSDSALLNDVLADSIRQHRSQAAKTAAEILGDRADINVLLATTPQLSPLADALSFPDRRVRFAALAAIMQLNPQSAFPGASRVPETLGYFASGASERRAVVAMPIADQATTLAGELTTLGIAAEPAMQGSTAVRLAASSVDLDLVLVDVDIDSPGIRDVLFALRSSPATGQVPIGLLATSERLATAKQIADDHTRIIAFPRPQNGDGAAKIAEQLTAFTAGNQVSPKELADMAGQALTWLGQLLAREQSVYDLRRQAPVIEAALYRPELAERSVAALTFVGTPESQRSLVDFASRSSVPIDARQQAAAAFQKNVAHSGILLTEEEILRQYDRYNASATADKATQDVLGNVLDTLESIRKRSAGRTN